jgi:hypothetical protein
MGVTKPHKFVWFRDTHATEPYFFIGFGWYEAWEAAANPHEGPGIDRASRLCLVGQVQECGGESRRDTLRFRRGVAQLLE